MNGGFTNVVIRSLVITIAFRKQSTVGNFEGKLKRRCVSYESWSPGRSPINDFFSLSLSFANEAYSLDAKTFDVEHVRNNGVVFLLRVFVLDRLLWLLKMLGR